MPKMNPEIKAKWIAALRSGDYEQAKGSLRDFNNPNAFCCLGVLCDVVKNGIDGRWEMTDFEYRFVPFDGGYRTGNLPSTVQSLTGVTQTGAIDSMQTSLTVLNDHGRSFNDIADIIERDF